MKEFIEKLISRLEEGIYSFEERLQYDNKTQNHLISQNNGIKYAIEIVNQLAEEYKDKTNIIDGLKAFLKDKFDYCAEQAEMNLEAECNSETPSYFRNRKELYLDRANIYGEVMREIDRLAEEYKGGWIACSERLPEVATCYLVTEEVTVNSKKQYVTDIRLFGTEDEWLCPSNRKIIAWQPLPAPYKEGCE